MKWNSSDGKGSLLLWWIVSSHFKTTKGGCMQMKYRAVAYHESSLHAWSNLKSHNLLNLQGNVILCPMDLLYVSIKIYPGSTVAGTHHFSKVGTTRTKQITGFMFFCSIRTLMGQGIRKCSFSPENGCVEKCLLILFLCFCPVPDFKTHGMGGRTWN